ncbi:von Willebrand factor D and EGF domain-containing protein [Nematostella vectensis]|uniref:von Willebrand factor D and EGF domain-containing protein n=1 Tax=Nematostella vectensis TaxID=45351 RepID=UPI0020771C53|nr:von Willebrand factor D and EGF domain-containing protein [Nematostella vectensis]
MPINAVPELLGVNEVGLCDVREESCNNTRIIGDGFIASENLTCHATEFKVFGNNWSPNAEQFELPGEQFDLYVVRCDLPSPPTKIGDMDNPGTPAGGLRIRISNNKLDTSREQKTFVSYDSVCIKCNKTGSCGLRADSCIINGHCFANEEPNPKDWCQQCFPTTSQFTWNRRRVNSNPIFTTPPVQFALVDEMLVLHIHARDPENRTVTYSIRSTDAQGYSFTLDGQLNYTMTSLSKTFTFVATDECNASDTMTLNLRVMECPCRNRGSCYPHPYYPRGSGQYECACPVGFNGSRCEVNINDCESNTCVNGTCLDGVANYTCLCDVGFKGQLCNEKVSNCSDDACYPGVNCTDISGCIACGPCPVGLTGNGKSCVTPTTTRRPTTTKPSTSQSTSKAISTRKQQESTFKDQTTTPTSEPNSIVPRPAKDNPQKTSKTKVIVIAVSGSVAAVIIITAASLLCRRKYVYHVKKRTQVHDSQEIKQADRHAYENPDYQEITEHTYERANKVSTAAYENIALDTVPNFDVPDKGVDPHQELKALKETYQPLEHKPVLPPIPSKNPEKPHENDYE